MFKILFCHSVMRPRVVLTCNFIYFLVFFAFGVSVVSLFSSYLHITCTFYICLAVLRGFVVFANAVIPIGCFNIYLV